MQPGQPDTSTMSRETFEEIAQRFRLSLVRSGPVRYQPLTTLRARDPIRMRIERR